MRTSTAFQQVERAMTAAPATADLGLEGIRELAVAFGRLTKEPAGVEFEDTELGGIAALRATPESSR
jgi:hypothetical protein